MSAIPELNGITISHKPGCFKENGQWKGIAFDILQRLEKVGACFLDKNDKLKCKFSYTGQPLSLFANILHSFPPQGPLIHDKS